MNTPLVDNEYILEKFSGKGGWVYVFVKEVVQDKKWPFGMLKVKGKIDDFDLNEMRLMPMGYGKMFLPVNGNIRKAIGKNVGDTVHLVLYADNFPEVKQKEFLLCLEDDPAAHKTFFSLSENEQKEITDWIFAVKSDELKVERIATALDKLSRGRKVLV